MARPKKAKPGYRRVVAVVWIDAAYDDHDDHADLAPVPAITYGEIIELTKDHIKVAGEVFADKSARQHTAIPRGMVKAIIQGFVKDPFLEKDVTP